jgi:diaminopimelate epimerase
MNATGITKATTININVEGGKLGVSFKKRQINLLMSLNGPATFVFEGTITI